MKKKIEKCKQYSVFTVSRLFYRKGYCSWVEDKRTFSSVRDAERHIEMEVDYKQKGATDRFLIQEVKNIEFVDYTKGGEE